MTELLWRSAAERLRLAQARFRLLDEQTSFARKRCPSQAAQSNLPNRVGAHSDAKLASVMDKYPVTPAVRFLREKRIPFEPHFYKYEEHGGTAHSASALKVPEHSVIKTLIMETDQSQPLVVLMHGDCEVSTKELARVLGTKTVAPCDPRTVQRLTGYMVGGCSPFGTRKTMPIYVESTIFSLPRIYINGGKRGFLVSIDPAHLQSALSPEEVNVAISSR